MRHSLLFVVLLVACDREEGQRHVCTKFAEQNVSTFRDPTSWIEQCVKERWTQRQMECQARGGGSFLGMFCE